MLLDEGHRVDSSVTPGVDNGRSTLNCVANGKLLHARYCDRCNPRLVTRAGLWARDSTGNESGYRDATEVVARG